MNISDVNSYKDAEILILKQENLLLRKKIEKQNSTIIELLKDKQIMKKIMDVDLSILKQLPSH